MERGKHTMALRKTSVKVTNAAKDEAKPLLAKPLCEVSKVVEVENGVDIYLVQGNVRYQLYEQASPFFGGKEYVFKGELVNGSEICFVHKDGKKIPVHGASNCGYTLVGKAKRLFEAKKALCANGETSDDQEYVYINQNSVLYYVGETGTHSLFVRIYDNLNGIDNDRWIVLFAD